MSVSYGKGPKGTATRFHSQVVRSLGYCQSCGAREALECAHIISRRYSATRTDELNAFCLCGKCHRRFTNDPVEWTDFIDRTIGREEYLRLRRKAESNLRPWTQAMWKAEAVRLRLILDERRAA